MLQAASATHLLPSCQESYYGVAVSDGSFQAFTANPKHVGLHIQTGSPRRCASIEDGLEIGVHRRYEGQG